MMQTAIAAADPGLSETVLAGAFTTTGVDSRRPAQYSTLHEAVLRPVLSSVRMPGIRAGSPPWSIWNWIIIDPLEGDQHEGPVHEMTAIVRTT